MRISDERNDSELIKWYETEKGEVYEFSVPSYSDNSFVGMVMSDDSFDLDSADYSLFIVDLENGYGFSIEDSSEIAYIKTLKAKLVLKR